jgi:hypothetical protein
MGISQNVSQLILAAESIVWQSAETLGAPTAMSRQGVRD